MNYKFVSVMWTDLLHSSQLIYQVMNVGNYGSLALDIIFDIYEQQEVHLSLTCLLTLYILKNVVMNLNPNNIFVAHCLVVIAIFIILLTNVTM